MESNLTDFDEDGFGELTETDLIKLERRLLCFQNDSSSMSTISTDILKSSNPSGLFCPRIFDGWSCWEDTPAGTTAYQPCPFFITGFDPNRFGHKQCLDDGTWFRHPKSNAIWSNYTTCVDIQDLARRQNVITIHEVGYLISVCALFISLIIYCSFRCLECTRVRIHKHLFVSFIINNILWLIWYRAVIAVPAVTSNPDHAIWCGTLHILVQYFLVANYFWMFCEGFYLHTLIVFTFTRVETKLLWGFAIFGWLGPTIPVGLYAGFRSADPAERVECMIHESKWNLFLSVPVCVSLISSLAFLVNILRVLLTKLKDNQRTLSIALRRESTIADNHVAVRKAAKATLILIPLLGLHYLLTPFQPEPGSEGEIIYQYISAVSLSLQGLSVSLLFCFCNSEVIHVLRRRFCQKYFPYKSGYHGDYSCGRTMSTSVINKEQHRLNTFSISPSTPLQPTKDNNEHFGNNFVPNHYKNNNANF